jgi:Flp pilus assembly protein TadG
MSNARPSARLFRRFWTDEAGASAVEFAIVGSVLIALCIAILSFGWALQIRSNLSQAADVAIRSIIIDPETSDSDLEAQVYAALTHYGVERLNVEAGETTVGATDFRTLSIEYDMTLSIPLLPTNLVTLNVSRRVPVS